MNYDPLIVVGPLRSGPNRVGVQKMDERSVVTLAVFLARYVRSHVFEILL